MQFDVIIIGAGPSGLFSAFQAGMIGMKSTIIDTLEVVSGQCAALYPEKLIYDIPAYPQILSQDLVINYLNKQPLFHHGSWLGRSLQFFYSYNFYGNSATSKSCNNCGRS